MLIPFEKNKLFLFEITWHPQIVLNFKNIYGMVGDFLYTSLKIFYILFNTLHKLYIF